MSARARASSAALFLVLATFPEALGRLALGASREGQERVGIQAPILGLNHWLNSPPLKIQDLAGKVVLVRWWTDTCPFCSTSAPALKELQRRYSDRGFQVLGIFHPKPPSDPSAARVRHAAHRFGFTFPVALDSDWKALNRWWLSHTPRGWTSVSFLIDKQGVIRYVHPGGEFHQGEGGPHRSDHSPCQRDYQEIDHLIQELLAE